MSTVITHERPELLEAASAPRPGGFWRRYAAWWLDIAIAVLITMVLATLLGLGSLDAQRAAWIAIGVTVVFYEPLQMIYQGQTWGHRALGLRVIRTNGDPIGFWRAMLRGSLIRMLLCGGFGFLAAIDATSMFREDRRVLHDLALDTKVVRG